MIKVQTKLKKWFTKTLVTNLIIVFMLSGIFMLTLNLNSVMVFGSEQTEAIYHGNESGNKISLRINVYWGNEYLQPILDILAEYQITTTFFVGGSWAEKNQDLLNNIIVQGHEIANHGYFHKDHSTLNYDQNYEEISVTSQLIKQVAGIDMNLFMPPSGAMSKTTLKAASDLGYKTILWSKDTIDWRDQDANLIYTRATKNIHGGDFVLMHPTAATVQALEKMLKYYKANYLLVTTVTDAL